MRTADGVTLHAQWFRATGARRGVVICLHAMMTDGRYFKRFATEVASGGYDVLVPDFRGHGKSELRAGRDDWSFDDLVELDAPAIIAGAECDPAKVVIVGHSLGGLVTTAALGIGAIPRPRCVLLPATSVWLLGPDGDRKRRALMAIYRHVTALLGRAPIRALRIGSSDEAATYVKQLTGWTIAAKWTSLRGVDYLAALRRIDIPVTPFAGAADWMCTPDDAREFAQHIPTSEPLRVVDRANHFTLFTKGEMRPLWRELLDGLERHA